MAAGLSQKQIKSRIYNRLQALKYKLEKAGVPVRYNLYELFHGDADGLMEGFNIGYRVLHASNGETAGLLNVTIIHNGQRERYEYPTYDKGILRIKQLFGKEVTNGNQQS